MLHRSCGFAAFGMDTQHRRDWARHQKISKNNRSVLYGRTCWANDRRAPGKIYIWHWIFSLPLLYFLEESSLLVNDATCMELSITRCWMIAIKVKIINMKKDSQKFQRFPQAECLWSNMCSLSLRIYFDIACYTLALALDSALKFICRDLILLDHI